MQVSEFRKPQRIFSQTPVAAAIVVALASSTALAQEKGTIEEITVTAQKRAENLQDVPISIQALGNQALEELNLDNFQQYVQMLPSVAMTPTPGAGAGFSLVYMRGIATGGDGQATTSQPSVGMYLDEQPITTIQGNLDIHMYDIARVEALAGPQGTLFGASSQAGTIRIISNQPDLNGFSAGYGIEGNMVDSDDTGYVAEGFVNIPMGDKTAIRIVGWNRRDAGYIDNVAGTRVFPGVEDPETCLANNVACSADDVTLDNSDIAKDNYNTMDTVGGRAALRIELNDNWTITPNVMAQRQEGEGSWGEDLSDFVSDSLQVTHFKEEFTKDEWYQMGLTIDGTIGNFELTYSGNYLDRQVDGSFDYSDYSYWYDTVYTTGYYADLHFQDTGPRTIENAFFDSAPGGPAGTRIMPGARFTNNDGYTKKSHELRLSTNQDASIRGMLGFFWQEQSHDFEQHWKVQGLGTVMLMNLDEPNGNQFPDTVYLNSMDRLDKDQAVFGNVSFDIGDSVEISLGARFFKPEVAVDGFFGFGEGFAAMWSGTGETQCPSQEQWGNDTPCKNVEKSISESESIYRINATYSVNDDSMVYFTWSEGYRPGGINRRPQAGNYVSDFLTNYEFGWKTQWLDNSLQFNGAIFYDKWDDFQVSFVGDNAITQVDNGPTADVTGLEGQLQWLPTDNLTLSTSFAFYNTELKDIYCEGCNDDGSNWADAGTKLPITADFKGNLIARYIFEIGSFEAHVQGAVSHEGERGSSMNQGDNAIRGDVPANTFVDLSTGIHKNSWSAELFIKNATNEDAPIYLTSQCATGTCGTQNYGVRARPMTIGLKWSQNF